MVPIILGNSQTAQAKAERASSAGFLAVPEVLIIAGKLSAIYTAEGSKATVSCVP